jgi:hypothetical protein
MLESEKQSIQHHCEALSHACARALDFRDQEALVELFCADGELEIDEPLTGTEQIRAAMQRRPDELRCRHVLTNHYVQVLDADNARGIAYVTLYRHLGAASLSAAPVPVGGPAGVGHFEDRYHRQDGQWRMRRRKLHLAFIDPAQWLER